jgi:AraC-like DNA-binding protein
MIFYKEIAPPKQLERYVQYFWVLDVMDQKQNLKTINILADKFPRLSIHCVGGTRNGNTLEYIPYANICGVSSQHATYLMDGRYSHIAVRFYPYAIKEIFGIDAHYAMDTFLDLHNFWPSDIIEQIINAKTYKEKINFLSNFMINQLNKKVIKNDQLVSHFVFYGYKNSYRKTLLDYQISERQFNRRFKETIGITSMMFRRMCRFEEALKRLRTHNFHELIDIPYELDYSDQSHFNREFKLFTGLNPTRFLSLQRKVEESNSFISE